MIIWFRKVGKRLHETSSPIELNIAYSVWQHFLEISSKGAVLQRVNLGLFSCKNIPFTAWMMLYNFLPLFLKDYSFATARFYRSIHAGLPRIMMHFPTECISVLPASLVEVKICDFPPRLSSESARRNRCGQPHELNWIFCLRSSHCTNL